MIKTYSLTKEYGGEKVLNLSELEIPKGELFGLIGIMVPEKPLFLVFYWT